MDQIKELTPEQQIRHDEFFNRAMQFGTATERADRPKAEAAFRELYRLINRPEPEQIIWTQGPMEAIELIASCKPETPKVTFMNQCLFGSHELSWSTYYLFCGTLREGIYSLEDARKLQLWQDIGESCGWWWPFTKAIVVFERPTICRLNENRVLHSDDSPAMQFADGTTVWAINGTRLPTASGEQIVMRPDTMTTDQILREPNEEVRRIMMERFGWVRFLRDTNAKELNRRFNQISQGWEVLYQVSESEREPHRLHVADPSTGREYVLGVRREFTTCEAAQNYISHGLEAFAIDRS